MVMMMTQSHFQDNPSFLPGAESPYMAGLFVVVCAN